MNRSSRILLVGDEHLNAGELLELLKGKGHELDAVWNGEEAWGRLESGPDLYDVIILERGVPRMNGLELLKRVKRHPVMQGIPVILEASEAARDEIVEGIQAGAWYYLTLPIDEELLDSVLGAAIEDRERYRRLQEESCVTGRALGLMQEGQFRFRTLEAARDVARALASICPNPALAVIGLSELLINAVEHGNLAISYEEKSRLCGERRWDEEVARRLADPRYAHREVEVSYRRRPAAIEVVICDQGRGFEWQRYLDMDPDRAFDTHGRGIAISRRISFDSVEYRSGGNEVVARIDLQERA